MATKVKNVQDIVREAPTELQPTLQEIFNDISVVIRRDTEELDKLFSAPKARDFLQQLEAVEQVFDPNASYQETIERLHSMIEEAEALRADMFQEVFRQIRPLERTYRQLYLFFNNSKATDGVQRPAELHILNSDMRAVKDPAVSTTLQVLERFIEKRNDSFNFRKTICNLIAPGFHNQEVRTRLENIGLKFGVLLISDLRDEKTVKAILDNYGVDGEYEFLSRPEDRAAAHVVTAGYLMVRPKHSFERTVDEGDDLYVPASLAFGGAIVRTDNTAGLGQGPVGTRFGQIEGALKCRVEPGITATGILARQKQVVPIIRSADNRVCFYGCKSLAQDEYGTYKYFTSFRILRHIERMICHHLRDVAFQTLNSDTVDNFVEKPIRRELNKQRDQGVILYYNLDINHDYKLFAQGICAIELRVQPAGPIETFKLKIRVPMGEGAPVGPE